MKRVSLNTNETRHRRQPVGCCTRVYPKVSSLERELQMAQLSNGKCSCIDILWVSLTSFAAITLCVASQRVFIVVSVYFVMTQSGNFWILPRTWIESQLPRLEFFCVPHSAQKNPGIWAYEVLSTTCLAGIVAASAGGDWLQRKRL
jgi:hypothetical protein